MAFSFDSPLFDCVAAAVLFAASIWSWSGAQGLRADIRVQLRFAAVLLAALAASLPMPAPGLAFNVLLLASSVASAALALSFCYRRPAPIWLSTSLLAAAFVVGLLASLAAMPLLALVFVGGAAAHIVAASVARLGSVPGFAAILGAASLLLAGLAEIDGGVAPAALFLASALGLLTRALEKPVEDPAARIKLLVS